MRSTILVAAVFTIAEISSAVPSTAPASETTELRFVVIGDTACDACVIADRLIERMNAAGDLRGFTLEHLDARRQRAAVVALEVTTTPAIRILDADGNVLAGTAGPIDAAGVHDLLDSAIAKRPRMSSIETADAWFAALDGDDAVARARAVAEIADRPSLAPAVVDRFARGTLRVRLALLDVLTRWTAPIGSLDPWRPETVDPASLDALRDWARRTAATQPATPTASPP